MGGFGAPSIGSLRVFWAPFEGSVLRVLGVPLRVPLRVLGSLKGSIRAIIRVRGIGA